MSRDIVQRLVSAWVRSTFGDEAFARQERARRLLEEVAELCQAEDIDKQSAIDVVNYVYAKPKGDPSQEIGGVALTLLAYAGSAGVSLEQAETSEFTRVLSIDKARFRERHNVKAEGGIAFKVPE